MGVRCLSYGHHACNSVADAVVAGVAATAVALALPSTTSQLLDTDGNMRYIPVPLPAPSTNFTQKCETQFLMSFDKAYKSYTGLSTSFRSDVSAWLHWAV